MVDWDDWQNMHPIRSYWSSGQYCVYKSGGFWGRLADSSGFARNKDVYTPSGTCVDNWEGPGTITYCSWNRKAGGAGAVAELQVRLQRAGYSLTADGMFGSISESRVKAFPLARGLDDDGKVGPATWEALRDYR